MEYCKSFLLFVILLEKSCCIRLVDIKIPDAVKPGEDVELDCAFDMQGSRLYSVKWYKDGVEFYRYVPKSKPQIRAFRNRGIHVNIEKSDAGRVYLNDLNFYSSGMYMCEASGEKPDFQTKMGQKKLIVYELPKPGLRLKITGERNTYKFGDGVILNCTSPPSQPAPNISWFINNVQMLPTKNITTEIKRTNMLVALSVLEFKLSASAFQDGKAKILCRATILNLYNTSSAVLLEHESIWNDNVKKGNGNALASGTQNAGRIEICFHLFFVSLTITVFRYVNFNSLKILSL
ncbi:Uncharacterised protein g2730 [Pycnogonum litorale]